MNTAENAAFEHAAKHILALAKAGDKYQDGYTQTCWELWQARALLHGKAAADVFSERKRQIGAEGWTPEHDDEHKDCELAAAAATYATCDAKNHRNLKCIGAQVWPGRWSFNDQGYRRNLVKAGALILAEIERLDRAAEKPKWQTCKRCDNPTYCRESLRGCDLEEMAR